MPGVDAAVSRRMSVTQARDTKPELALRRELHRRGRRFRVGTRPVAEVRRTGDIVFPRARVAVLVDGCFWHGCPAHYVAPKTRAGWWEEKIARNRERDRETTALWEAAGWTVLRVWEHEDPAMAADRVETALARS